jgi:hypothetical protein
VCRSSVRGLTRQNAIRLVVDGFLTRHLEIQKSEFLLSGVSRFRIKHNAIVTCHVLGGIVEREEKAFARQRQDKNILAAKNTSPSNRGTVRNGVFCSIDAEPWARCEVTSRVEKDIVGIRYQATASKYKLRRFYVCRSEKSSA